MAIILLIDCECSPRSFGDGDHHRDYEVVKNSEPLGLEYLQAYLVNRGHEVSILQAPSNDQLIKYAKKADIIGFSVLTYQWSYFKNLVGLVKQINDQAILVAGREHPTSFPEICLKETSIDYVVLGEGEIPLSQIADGFSKEDISGIAYLKDGEIVINKRPHRLEILSHHPVRQIDRMSITLKEWVPLGDKAAGIMLSRGCYFNCDFCTKQIMWGKHYICRDIDDVIDEIVSIKKNYGVEIFAFHDLMFPPNLLHKFCSRIIERRVSAKFFSMMSATSDRIDWRLVKEAGFFEIGVGLEIPSDKRADIGKRHNFSMAKGFINAIADAGILTRVYTIIGWPDNENAISVRNDYLHGLSEISSHILRVHFLTPFPGTLLWNRYKENFIYPIPEGFRHFTTMEPVLRFGMNYQDLVELRKSIINTYYSSSKFSSLYKDLDDKRKKMIDIFKS